ncbi:MAG: flagellar basal body-associated FliL family protein [Oscillospiraceae bacterium]|jgi:flagellar basal body-associated protein FliL|nr:flagellar basal body-associated FliL family protein [Oscillospiraceae bacterium]
MKKKLIPILIAAVVVVAGALYFLVFNSGGAEKPVVYTEYSPGEFFVTNVDGTTNLLKTTLVLVLDTDETGGMTAANTRIRDTIIAVLRSIDLDTLLDVDMADSVKKRIADAVNARLEITNVVDVLYNDFVVQ